VMDYGGTLLIFEVRGLKTDKFHGEGIGNLLHFEAGVVAGGKFFPGGKGPCEPLPTVEGAERRGGDHFANFVAGVRSRKTDELHAEIGVGHVSAGLCHLANISYRLGKEESFNPRTGTVSGNDFAAETLARMEEHLKENGVKLTDVKLRAGRKLELDGTSESFKGDPEANALLTRAYRAPFVVPNQV